MKGAGLQGASLGGAGLQSAILHGAQVGGANVWTDHLTFEQQRMRGPADDHQRPSRASLPPFAERIRKWIGKEGDLFAEDAKFSGAKFEGGLSQDDVDSLARGLPDDDEKMLRIRLNPHIDKPTNRQLPDGSGAITVAYTEEEAEKWIAEYDKAMSEVPGDDS